MQHIFYISTGAKNARYTLRHQRFAPGAYVTPDSFICVLADDIDRAAEKARDYFDRVKDRFENAILVEEPDYEIGKRRGKLSLKATRQIEKVEAGLFPFGKYNGTVIVDAPDSYILYWADQSSKQDMSAQPVLNALASICMGLAMDRDLIAKRQEKRDTHLFVKLCSQFEGTVGERRNFEGVVFAQYYNDEYGFYNTQVLLDNGNIVSYAGNKLGERGERLNFDARIHSHGDYNGCRSTKVKRPGKVRKVEQEAA